MTFGSKNAEVLEVRTYAMLGFRMDTLHEIEAAVDALPETQHKELFRHLAERFLQEPKIRLPLVPLTGDSITQKEIDDALGA